MNREPSREQGRRVRSGRLRGGERACHRRWSLGEHPTVSGVGRSVAFYRDVVGLPLALQVPERGAAFFWIADPGEARLGLWSLGSVPSDSRDLLAQHNALVRRELGRFRGEERDTAGDGFFATFDGPARAIRCAQAIVSSVRGIGLEVRTGIHVGECELHEGKVAGIAISVGARVAAAAGAGEVLVSSIVRDLVAGSGIEFESRGEHELKGVPGAMRL